MQTEAELRVELDLQPWEIVLCDYAMPGFGGVQAIRVIREVTGGTLPVIVISGTIGEEAAVEVLKIGASDYLLKGNLTRLDSAVRRTLADAETRRERTAAEEALRRREESYRVLFERNPIPMWVFNASTWEILEVNGAALAQYGYSREEFISMPVWNLHAADQADAWITETKRKCADGALCRGVWRHCKKDGTTIYVDVATQPIVQGGVEARMCQAIDVTEREEAGQSLSRIKMAVEYASDVISLTDATGRAIYLNRAYTNLFGYDVAALNEIGGPAALFINQAIIEQVGAAVAQVGSWSGEAFLRARSGDPVELFVRINAVRDADGQAVSFIGVGTDLGEARRAQRTIAEQAALLDKAQDAITVSDLNGFITYWNKGAERIFGWPVKQALGKSMHFLYEAEAYERAMAAVLKDGAWSGELSLRTMDDREVLIQARWTLVRDEKGEPKSVLAIETDITEKKSLEAQFLRAQRMESIGTLAGGIAHDLNNVLGPIIMAVDLFKLTMKNPRDLELLETVEVSARRGAEMVKQVLSFARGFQGQRMLVKPVDLLRDLQKIAGETFPKSITVQTEMEQGVWSVFADPTQLHQVLLNLCVNARDAMPTGGLLRLKARNLRVDAQFATSHPDARPGSYVVFEVSDTGMGMPPEISARMFEPFFTTKDVTRGTGLGLSTSLAIVRSHEGFINFETAAGQGTKFAVYVPADLESTESTANGGGEVLPRGNGEYVLVIDDEASIRSITSQTLDAFGYHAITASDGADGVAKYAQRMSEIAVVITDMMMPVMDGPVTIRALMKLNPKVKVIAVSGLTAKSAEAEAAGQGVKTFLAKPFTAATLLTTLRKVLREEGE